MPQLEFCLRSTEAVEIHWTLLPQDACHDSQRPTLNGWCPASILSSQMQYQRFIQLMSQLDLALEGNFLGSHVWPGLIQATLSYGDTLRRRHPPLQPLPVHIVQSLGMRSPRANNTHTTDDGWNVCFPLCTEDRLETTASSPSMTDERFSCMKYRKALSTVA